MIVHTLVKVCTIENISIKIENLTAWMLSVSYALITRTMVGQVRVKQVTQFEFPPGEESVTYKTSLSTTFKAGSIPSHVTTLDMYESAPVFEEGAITADLKYLRVKDITAGSHYPSHLHIVIHYYSGKQPLPNCARIYIHFGEVGHIKPEREHDVFRYNDDIPDRKLVSPTYSNGDRSRLDAFGHPIHAVKRIPIITTPVLEPAVVAPSSLLPTDVQTRLAEEQIKVAVAQQTLLAEQTKLAQAKREFYEKKTRALDQA